MSTFPSAMKCIGTLLLLIVCVIPATFAQEKTELPQDLAQLIELKTKLLDQFAAEQKAGQAGQSIVTLKKIIDIHRQAVKVATASKVAENTLGQLRQVFASDGEYLSDQLFARNDFAESAALRSELKQFLSGALGEKHQSTRIMYWKQLTAEKLNAATKELQTAYLVAAGSESQAAEALKNRQLDVAAKLYSQLIEAQIAVLGENHPNVGLNLNQYGTVLLMQKNYPTAESTYLRALKIREATDGRGLAFATTSFNLARFYDETQRFDEAAKMYLQTAEIEEPLLGKNNKSYLQTLEQLAALYKKTGQGEKEAALRKRINSADPLNTVVAHLPKGTFAGASIQPSQLLQDPSMKMLPFEIAEAWGRQELGFNPLDIQALVAFGTLPIVEPPFNFGLLFRLTEGAAAKFPWEQEGNSEIIALENGQKYWRSLNSGIEALCASQFPDGTIVLGTEESVKQSLTQAADGTVATMLLENRNNGQIVGVADVRLIRAVAQAALAQAPPLPPELAGLAAMPGDVDTVRIWGGVSTGLGLALVLDHADSAAAQRTVQALTSALALGEKMALAELTRNLGEGDAVQQATLAYAKRTANDQLSQLKPVVDGNSVGINFQLKDGGLVGPIGIALLLPAVQASRDAARRMQDSNQLKQIALGLLNYESTYGKFPARANYDAAGKPLLSWRVLILPYLEEMELYNQFHLDEPWDSEHNLKLAAQMPDVYRSQSFNDPLKTIYLTADGKGTAMEGNQGIKFSQISDGTSNTMMVLEVNPENAVVWTQPADLPFDPANPGVGLGAIRPNGFQAAFVDGSVHLISPQTTPDTLRKLLQCADGEIVNFDDY